MTAILKTFVMLFCINIIIVLNGYTITDIKGLEQTPLYRLFGNQSAATLPTTPSEEALRMINPSNFTPASVGSGDPSAADYKLFDPVALLFGFLNILISILFAPVILASALAFPAWLTWMVAMPMTVIFLISGVLVIRGIGG